MPNHQPKESSELILSRYNHHLASVLGALKLFTRGNRVYLRGTLPLRKAYSSRTTANFLNIYGGLSYSDKSSTNVLPKSINEPAKVIDLSNSNTDVLTKQYKLSTHCLPTAENLRYLYHLSLEVAKKLELNAFDWGWLDESLHCLRQSQKKSCLVAKNFLSCQEKDKSEGATQIVNCHKTHTEGSTQLLSSNSKSIMGRYEPPLPLSTQSLAHIANIRGSSSTLPILEARFTAIIQQLKYERLVIKGIKSRTWQLEYVKPFEHLQQTAQSLRVPISSALIELILLQFDPITRKRRRYYSAYKLLLKSLGIHYDLDALKGSYSNTFVLPRVLPNDDNILDAAEYLKHRYPSWYYAYCYLAIYGLRNTELLTLSYEHYPALVVHHSKTGRPRYILPFHEQWVEQLQIPSKIQLPNVQRKDSYGFSHTVTDFFRKASLSFRPKELRHCYARRMAELNYPAIYAAKMMGHSLKVHESVYMNFIGLRSYEIARSVSSMT